MSLPNVPGTTPAPKPLPPAPVEQALKAIEAPVYKLTAADRCDTAGCGSRAFMRASFSAGDLLFCRHHGTAVEAKLRATSTHLLDERGHLTAMVEKQPSNGAFA